MAITGSGMDALKIVNLPTLNPAPLFNYASLFLQAGAFVKIAFFYHVSVVSVNNGGNAQVSRDRLNLLKIEKHCLC
jgi:hypothetical protein